MEREGIRQLGLIENIIRERNIMNNSSSNFITRLHCTFKDHAYYYLAMEWAEGGDLYSFISKKSKRSVPFLEAG
jgi:serine/threonine protein kinase